MNHLPANYSRGYEAVMKLKVKKLHPEAHLPTKAHSEDAGWDLYALEDTTILAGDHVLVKTGIAMEIPRGYAGLIWSRSGLSVKRGIDVLAGVIDHGYTGEVGACLLNTRPVITEIKNEWNSRTCVSRIVENPYINAVHIKKGDRIAQILIQPVPYFELTEVKELSDSERSLGGFGSTGA